MDNAVWIKKTLFADGPGRGGIIVLSLISWLFIFTVAAKMFLGCAANFRQAAMPFGEHFYKIDESTVDSAWMAEKITLPSFMNEEIFSPGPEMSTDDLSLASLNSIYDLSAIANIGALSAPDPAQEAKRDAPLNRSVLLNPIINSAAAQYQVDPALVRAIIFAESGYNSSAVSKRGAMGLMQLMPGTARAMGVENCFDPEHNIYGGVKYFKKLVNQFDGDVKLALAAYNAGSRKVREFNGIPPFRATEYYIQKVMKYYKIFKSQEAESVGLS